MSKKKDKPARPGGTADCKPAGDGSTPSAGSKTKADKGRRKSNAKVLRNEAILADAMAGKKTTEIAEKFELSRQTVSEILNSPDAKARAELIQRELVAMVPHALKTVFDSIKIGDYMAARDVLRSTGSLQDNKKIEVTGKGGGPVKVEAQVNTELKISLEERVKLLKGEG